MVDEAPDPETPCVCGHGYLMHAGGHGCDAQIRVGGLVLEEGDGLVSGVKLTPCPCPRFVGER